MLVTDLLNENPNVTCVIEVGRGLIILLYPKFEILELVQRLCG